MTDDEKDNLLKRAEELANYPDFINNIRSDIINKTHPEYIKDNKYVPPGQLSKQETLQALVGVYVAIGSIKNPLSRGDRIYYDLKSIIGKALDEIQILKDGVYNDDEVNQ